MAINIVPRKCKRQNKTRKKYHRCVFHTNNKIYHVKMWCWLSTVLKLFLCASPFVLSQENQNAPTRQNSNLLAASAISNFVPRFFLSGSTILLDGQICISEQSAKNYRHATANNEYSSNFTSLCFPSQVKRKLHFLPKRPIIRNRQMSTTTSRHKIIAVTSRVLYERYSKSVSLMEGFLILKYVFTSVGAKCSYQLQLNY